MPAPVVEPRPSMPALRFGAPEDAQEASYFAASARMRSFFESFSSMRFMVRSEKRWSDPCPIEERRQSQAGAIHRKREPPDSLADSSAMSQAPDNLKAKALAVH